MQNFKDTRTFFLLISILTKYAIIFNDENMNANIQIFLSKFEVFKNINYIILNPNITLEQDQLNELNKFYKNIVHNLKVLSYDIEGFKTNYIVSKNDENTIVFELNDEELNEIIDSKVLKLTSNVLTFETNQVKPTNKINIKNQLQLNFDLERDLKVSEVSKDLLIYRSFELIDDDFLENKDNNKQLSSFYDANFFKNNFLIYLSIQPQLLQINKNKVIALYKLPFDIQNNEIIQKDGYVYIFFDPIIFQNMENLEIKNALKGIYISMSNKNIDNNIKKIIKIQN